MVDGVVDMESRVEDGEREGDPEGKLISLETKEELPGDREEPVADRESEDGNREDPVG